MAIVIVYAVNCKEWVTTEENHIFGVFIEFDNELTNCRMPTTSTLSMLEMGKP